MRRIETVIGRITRLLNQAKPGTVLRWRYSAMKMLYEKCPAISKLLFRVDISFAEFCNVSDWVTLWERPLRKRVNIIEVRIGRRRDRITARVTKLTLCRRRTCHDGEGYRIPSQHYHGWESTKTIYFTWNELSKLNSLVKKCTPPDWSRLKRFYERDDRTEEKARKERKSKAT